MQIHICTKFTLLSEINETNTNPNPTAGCSRPKLCCTENDKIWRFFCVLPLSSNEFKPATNRIDKYIKPRMKLKMMFNCVQCILTGVYFPQFLADVCHRRLPTVNIQVVLLVTFHRHSSCLQNSINCSISLSFRRLNSSITALTPARWRHVPEWRDVIADLDATMWLSATCRFMNIIVVVVYYVNEVCNVVQHIAGFVALLSGRCNKVLL